MKKAFDKIASEKGETLAETLASLAIAAVSAVLAAVMLTAAYQINLRSRAADAEFYSELSAAEDETKEPIGRIRVIISEKNTVDMSKRVEIDADLYGGSSLRSYSAAKD